MRRMLVLLSVMLLAGGVLPAQGAESYGFDKAHSHIGFSVRHMGLAKVRGDFSEYQGSISFNEQEPTASSVEITIQVASIDTANERRDEHLRSADFFDAEGHPTITFKSKSIESTGDGSYQVTGDLTMRGTTKEVTIPVSLFGPISGQQGKRIGVEGELTVDRQEYGINFSRLMDNGGLVVSDDVDISFSVEATSPAAQ